MEADYMMLTILQGDAIEQLRTLPAESVQCCVTSPPYWGLRDYGTAAWEGGDEECDHLEVNDTRDPAICKQTTSAGTSRLGFREACGKCGAKRIDSQLGLEKTPDEYVAKMVEVFREVRRVLRKDGTLWLNLGDSYANNFGTNYAGATARVGNTQSGEQRAFNRVPDGLKPKDLCGITWRVAFALQADGWWLRSDIIWAKPNPMPESVTDRPTKSHEYLFLLTKSASYFYDAEAIKEAVVREWDSTNGGNLSPNRIHKANGEMRERGGEYPECTGSRNKRSVWTVATAPYPEAHFATYPPDLIKPCIMAGTSAKGCCAKCGSPWDRVVRKSGGTTGKSWHDHKNDLQVGQRGGNEDHRRAAADGYETDYKVETLGWQPTCKCDADIQPCVCLDPFAGSGTTGMVALELGRKAVLIELNPKYCDLIRQRTNVTPGLQLA